jgi:hypothetical protein
MRRAGTIIARWSATLFFAFVSTVVNAAAGGEPPRGPQWSLLHKSDTGLSLSFVIPDPLWIRNEGGGRSIDLAIFASGVAPSLHELPQHTFTFLLPAHTALSSVHVSLEGAEWMDPTTGAVLASEGDVSSQERWLPENPIISTEFTPYGNYILLRTTLAPVSFNAHSNTTRALRSGIICVRHAAPDRQTPP